MADGKELGPWPLGVLADFLGLRRKPGIEQGEGSVGVDELFGVVVVGGDLADADVLLQLDTNFRKIVQAAEHLPADGGAIIEIAWNQPIHVIGSALLKCHTQAGAPHLAGIHAPGVQNVRVARDGVFPEIQEGLVAVHGVVGFAIHDCYGAGISLSVRVQASDQLVEFLQVGVMSGLTERINDHRMNPGRLRRPR